MKKREKNLYIIDDVMYDVVFVSWPLIGILLFFFHNEQKYEMQFQF